MSLPSISLPAVLLVVMMTWCSAFIAHAQDTPTSISIDPAACVIVMPDDLAQREKLAQANLATAADELKHHFKLVFNRDLPVIAHAAALKQGQYPLHLGVIPASDDKPLAWQESRYAITPQGLWLYGDSANHGRSDLSAVYDFLEQQLGIHWVEPGDAGIVYQTMDKLTLAPGNHAWVPQLVFRKIRQSIRHDQPHRPIGRPNTDDFLLSKEEHNRRVDEELQWMDRMRMGGSRPGGGHAFSKWWGRYGKDHPEYFALTSRGERAPAPLPKGRQRSEEFIKICPSNPAIAQRLIEEWLPRKDIIQYISTGPNDGTQNWCECDACKALDVRKPGEAFGTHLTDRYVHLTNEVAKLARQHRPDAYATLYAYLTTLYPPRREKLEPNVAVLIVPYVIPLKLSLNRELFKGWKDAGATKLAIRPNYHHKYMQGSLPLGIEKQMFDVFQQAVENGAISADYDMMMGHWAVTGMSDYILAKAMADPAKPFEYWQDEYCSAYGQAAADAKAYFQYWRQEVWESRLLPAIDDITTAGRAGFFNRGLMWTLAKNNYYRLDDFDKTDAILKNAAARDLLPRQRARVEQLILANAHARKVFIAATSRGQAQYAAAADLMTWRKAHKELNVSWVRLIGIEEQYNWTGIRLAHELGAYPLPWLETGMAWKFRMDPDNTGLSQNWQSLTYEQVDDWKQLRTDNFWERAYDSETEPVLRKALARYDGGAWYISRVLTPTQLKGRQMFLRFGGVGDTAIVYVNGQKVGQYTAATEKEKNQPFEIRIDQAIDWTARFTNLTVHVENKSGLGGLYNRVWLVSKE